MDLFSMFDLGSLNENKKITAKFTKYEVMHRSGETYISAQLENDQLPEWQEGYGLEGDKLFTSLWNLYRKIENVDDWEACHHIIVWCKENAFPYYTESGKLQAFDWHRREDKEYWAFMVNFLESYEFPLSKITADLQRLYEDTEILQYFYCLRHDFDFGRKLPNTERAQKYANIASLSEIELLRELDRFLSELPKFPMELTIDELGELKILPGFNSVFEAAYYALARFMAISPDAPTRDGGKTPLAICESCGKIFVKNGNRQTYCDDPECKKERNRRKARTAYRKRISNVDGETK